MMKQISLRGVDLHYDESGPDDGAPVVVMHGWGCSHTTVESIARPLAAGMHVFNLDLPGHGDSSEPPAVWGVDEYTRLVEDFIAAMYLGRPSLIGHSFGGRIAILLSSRNEVGKVMLVDAAGIKPKRPLKYYIKVYSFKTMRHLAYLLMGKEKGAAWVERRRAKTGSADYRNSSPRMRQVMSKVVNEDLRHCMPQIKASVLLVWGERDTATPLSDAKTMERLMPEAGLVVFPGAGHYSFLDNFAGFQAVLREFFKSELSHPSGKTDKPE